MKQIDVLPEYENYIKDYRVSLNECKCFCFEAGELILEQGAKGEFLYFIVEGIAKVQVSSADGKILSLSYSHAERVLGEVELVSGNETASTLLYLNGLVEEFHDIDIMITEKCVDKTKDVLAKLVKLLVRKPGILAVYFNSFFIVCVSSPAAWVLAMMCIIYNKCKTYSNLGNF